MAKLKFLINSHGLLPADDDSRVWLNSKRGGDIAQGEFSVMRNGKFHRKWWSLVKCGFDWWNPSHEAKVNGIEVKKNFERFRKDTIIRTGRYAMVVNTKNEVKAEADSISWAKMDEVEFTKLYDDTVTVLLKLMPSHITEENLRNAEASIMEYA